MSLSYRFALVLAVLSSSLKKKKKLLIYLAVLVLVVACRVLVVSCGVFRCRHWTLWLWLMGSAGAARGLSYPAVCGVLGFTGGSAVKNLPASVGDTGLIPGLGRVPGEGNGNPLHHSCLVNPMDRGAWWSMGLESQT